MENEFKDAFGVKLSVGDTVEVYKLIGKKNIKLENFKTTAVIRGLGHLGNSPVAWFAEGGMGAYHCFALKKVNVPRGTYGEK